jgi:hypothetical protein
MANSAHVAKQATDYRDADHITIGPGRIDGLFALEGVCNHEVIVCGPAPLAVIGQCFDDPSR